MNKACWSKTDASVRSRGYEACLNWAGAVRRCCPNDPNDAGRRSVFRPLRGEPPAFPSSLHRLPISLIDHKPPIRLNVAVQPRHCDLRPTYTVEHHNHFSAQETILLGANDGTASDCTFLLRPITSGHGDPPASILASRC